MVHCVASTVSMALIADGLLAAGARPMMTETPAEAPVVTLKADALLVNLGTLSTDAADGIPPTIASARAVAHPWVLDPAAVGAAPLRTPLAVGLLDQGPSIVRANASEILVLAGMGSGGRGADATDQVGDAEGSARAVARRTGGVVAVSGPTDLVTDGHRTAFVPGGTPLLTRVSGTGCLLGALTAACAAVAPPWEAALAASTWLATAGELAATGSAGPGTFRVALVDALDATWR